MHSDTKDVKQHQGIWLPAHEQHMLEWMDRNGQTVNGRGTYQYKKLQAALGYCKNFRTAIDVGAHVGFWSMHLAEKFERVVAFEPLALHRKCFSLNLGDRLDHLPVTQTPGYAPSVRARANVTLCPLAVGEKAQARVVVTTMQGSSGDSKVSPTGNDAGEPVRMVRLDDGTWGNVDFLKIDCEGFELFVVRGAEELLLRDKPCVIVEQKHKFGERYGVHPQAAVAYLQGLGAVLRKEMGGDYIMTWD